MKRLSFLRIFALFGPFFIFFSCAEKPAADPCCIYTELAPATDLDDSQGALQVEGSTSTYFYVLDESGNQVGYQSLNQTLPLDPGRYQIKVNNSLHPLEVQAGRLARCSTGTLMVAGNTPEYFYVMDSTNHDLAYETLGKSLSLFPGSYKVKVNNRVTAVEIKLKELTQVRTGTLLVHGSTGEYYYVLDEMNEQLNYNTLEKPLAFLPGSYPVKVNKTTMNAEILAGQLTELVTGSVLVRGLTDEYYYVTDTTGNALNYQSLNKSLAFFPGAVQIKVNNTLMKGAVSPGLTTEFVTGSIMLTGGGTGYYYVLDDAGNSLNYNSLNKSLSFFPSEYVVKIGASTRKAKVNPGQLTSISAFN